MDARAWRRLVGGASMLAGGGMVVAIVVHAIATTGTALEKRDALDERWAVLQIIGLVAALAGGTIGFGGWTMWRGAGETRDWLAVNGTAALFLMLLLSVTFVLGPVGPVAYASYLLLLGIGARRLGFWTTQTSGVAS